MRPSSSENMITTLPSDLIQTHILTRLDGATLASAACTSAHLHRLCAADNLWRNICTATWPSLNDPRVRAILSTFPNGHRSIFNESFPSLQSLPTTKNNPQRPSIFPELISGVDIYYKGKPFFSKVLFLNARTNRFLCSPLGVELLDPEEFVPTPISCVPKDENVLKDLEDNLRLSWIMIDPTRKRSGNLSSRRPVSVSRHWLTRDMEVVYSVTVVRGEVAPEIVRCMVKVTCGGKAGRELHVRGVSLMVEDLVMNGKGSLGSILMVMENGERKKVTSHEVAKGRHEKFLKMEKERRERKQRIEKAMDMVLIVVIIFVIVLFLWV